MLQYPKEFQELVQCFAPAFTRPSFERFRWLTLAAILTWGSHTVSNMLRTLSSFQSGHFSSFHRLLSHRRWKPWRLARNLCTLVLSLVPAEQVVYLAGDDTVAGHRGRRVYGKGCHRDAVRSSRAQLAYRWGHKWVVLSVLVKFPWNPTRPWALPCLVALYRPRACNESLGRPHKTPPEILQALVAQLIHWFPERKFLLSGDRGFGTQGLAHFAHRHERHLTLVSRLVLEARLFAPPPPKVPGARGRARIKGRKLPTPKAQVSHTPPRCRKLWTVAWYGGGVRRVRTVSDTGLWHRSCANGHLRRKTRPIPIRWVFVEDRTGTHREEIWFSTDPHLSEPEIIEAYVGRWSLETTFQEMRPYLGLERTRGWSEHTVLRTAPSLFGLYSFVVLLFCLLPGSWKSKRPMEWSGKAAHTFSDAITQVRRWLWSETIFASPAISRVLAKLTPRERNLLIHGLAPAA